MNNQQTSAPTDGWLRRRLTGKRALWTGLCLAFLAAFVVRGAPEYYESRFPNEITRHVSFYGIGLAVRHVWQDSPWPSPEPTFSHDPHGLRWQTTRDFWALWLRDDGITWPALREFVSGHGR